MLDFKVEFDQKRKEGASKVWWVVILDQMLVGGIVESWSIRNACQSGFHTQRLGKMLKSLRLSARPAQISTRRIENSISAVYTLS